MRWKSKATLRREAMRTIRNLDGAHTGTNGYGMVALSSEQLAAYSKARSSLGRWDMVLIWLS